MYNPICDTFPKAQQAESEPEEYALPDLNAEFDDTSLSDTSSPSDDEI